MAVSYATSQTMSNASDLAHCTAYPKQVVPLTRGCLGLAVISLPAHIEIACQKLGLYNFDLDLIQIFFILLVFGCLPCKDVLFKNILRVQHVNTLKIHWVTFRFS